jgi:dynein heavy chain 2, cytosolic
MILNDPQVDSIKAGIEGRISNFNGEFEKFSIRWSELKPNKVAIQDPAAALATLQMVRDIKHEFAELKGTADIINRDCASFDISTAQFSGIDDLEAEINGYEESWTFYEEFTKSLQLLKDENWLTFRNKLYVFDDYLTGWSEKAKSRAKDSVTVYVISELDKYRDIFPSLKNVRGDALTPEHWAELYRMLGIPKGTSITDLTLGTFLNVADAIVKNSAAVKELNNRAQGEVTIREALQELKAWASATEYAFTEFTDIGASVSLIKDWKDLLSAVSDNQSLVLSLKDSPYFKSFADDASTWEVKLGNLMDFLGKLNNVQRRWLYLVPIFGKGLFPGEGARFDRVDREFRNLMGYVTGQKRVVSLVEYTDIKDILLMMNDQLERCQKALSDFLETKRSSFPRFYFIGDDDLLEILGQAANPVVIQSHLKKLFQGINSVDFSSDKKTIIAMKSSVGEVIVLQNPVAVSERVEEWLSKLAAEMKNTLKHLLVKCLQVQDINTFPSQILCCAEEIHFTERCEFAITKGKLPALLDELKDQLSKLVSYDANGNNVNYLKVKALILDIIHDMDITENLIKNKGEFFLHFITFNDSIKNNM